MVYRADIDGLRAIAILLVVIFHFEIVSFGKSGFIGVDVFFVISGFLITKIIARELIEGTFRLGDFYLKRVRRLYPALLATLVLYLMAGYLLFLPELYAELAKQTLLSLGYAVNFYFWQNVNYFGLQAAGMPLLHMWSLAIEEQFYLLYPLVMLGIWRFWRRGLLTLLVLATLLSFGLGLFAAGWKPEAAFYLLPTRAWELLMGGVLALAWPKVRLGAGFATWLGLAGLTAILAALVIHSPVTRTPGWFTLLPTLGAAALILAGSVSSAPTTRLLAFGPMVWLGKVSYPLYLVHWPILILLKDALPDYSWSYRAAGLLVSVLLAWAVWRFVETPIRSMAISLRSIGLRFGIVTIAIACAAGVIFTGAGLDGRFSKETQRFLSFQEDWPGPAYKACDEFAPGPCPIGTGQEAPRVFAFGDSHAMSLSPALDAWLKDDMRPGVFNYATLCLPVAGTGLDRCARFTERMLRTVEQMPSIETVLLVSSWRQPYGPNGLLVNGEWSPPGATQPAFSAALVETVRRLQAAGKEVVLVEPLFTAPRAVPETLAKNTAFGRSWSVDTPIETYRQHFVQLFEAFEMAEAAGARRISLIRDFCSDGLCRGVRNGQPMFADSNHLAAGMAPEVAEILRREMDALSDR